MKTRSGRRDSVRFYEAGAAALRERLSETWKIAPDEVTAAEAAARLGRDEPIVAIWEPPSVALCGCGAGCFLTGKAWRNHRAQSR